jgi:hypothetical protein
MKLFSLGILAAASSVAMAQTPPVAPVDGPAGGQPIVQNTSPPIPPPWAGKRTVYANACGAYSFSFSETENALSVGDVYRRDQPQRRTEMMSGPATVTFISQGNQSHEELYLSNGRRTARLVLRLYAAEPGRRIGVRLIVNNQETVCEADVVAPAE